MHPHIYKYICILKVYICECIYYNQLMNYKDLDEHCFIYSEDYCSMSTLPTTKSKLHYAVDLFWYPGALMLIFWHEFYHFLSKMCFSKNNPSSIHKLLDDSKKSGNWYLFLSFSFFPHSDSCHSLRNSFSNCLSKTHLLIFMCRLHHSESSQKIHKNREERNRRDEKREEGRETDRHTERLKEEKVRREEGSYKKRKYIHIYVMK